MGDSKIDWTDETLRPLEELARLAFPDGGVTGKTLYRRAREGKLAVYRPGKSYLACLAGVRLMIEKTRVHPAPEPRPTPAVPNSLGLTEMDLSLMALDRALGLPKRRLAKEAKQVSEEERALSAAAHRLKIQERRRVRARAKYRKTVEHAKDEPN
jgi:hypothetical protein